MILKALQLDNLTKIAEEAIDQYVNFREALPGKLNCDLARDFIAERLQTQLGEEPFNKYVSGATFNIGNVGNHYLVIVGEKKTNFIETFESGIKIDPTIYQFRDIYPELDSLNKKCIFNEDYPKIYVPGSLKEYRLN